MSDYYFVLRLITIAMYFGITLGLALELKDYGTWSAKHRLRQLAMMGLMLALAYGTIITVMNHTPGGLRTFTIFFPVLIYGVGVWWNRLPLVHRLEYSRDQTYKG